MLRLQRREHFRLATTLDRRSPAGSCSTTRSVEARVLISIGGLALAVLPRVATPPGHGAVRVPHPVDRSGR
jgi:hypothetical protein